MHVASLPTYVRWDDPKHIRRRSIETGHAAITADHDDRNVDRIKDADNIGAYGVRGRKTALRPAGLVDPDLSFSRLDH
ncbi:MAG TPA: hypothetical protein VGD63_03440 [Steroidobacteraceae bacterium]